MSAPNLDELRALDLEERLALVQELWDSIVDDPKREQLPLSEAERQLLDERVREDDEDPDAAIPWAEARARLRTR
jgi:putative addiction module component (TIGR02574 family)